MDCQEVTEKLPAYIDGELDFEEARRIRSHLTRCYYCNEKFKDLKECLAACRHVLRHPHPRERFQHLSAAMHAPETEDVSLPFRRGATPRLITGRLAVAAAVIIFSLITSAFLNGAQSLSEPLNTRAVLNEKPELRDPMTTVASNVYFFRSGR
ncbi:MAG: zf-HC2 domain-containing protein [Candidatus Hydrogenedentota bacterium]